MFFGSLVKQYHTSLSNLYPEGSTQMNRHLILDFMKNGNLHYYHPDFFIPIIDSYVEVKGYFSDENKKKMNAVVDFNPGVKIIFIDTFHYKMLFDG